MIGDWTLSAYECMHVNSTRSVSCVRYYSSKRLSHAAHSWHTYTSSASSACMQHVAQQRAPQPHAHATALWWISGAAFDSDSPVAQEWMGEIAKRARHDATAQRATVRSQFKGRAIAGKM